MSAQSRAFNQRLITALTYSVDANEFCKNLIFSILNVCGAQSAAIFRLGLTESIATVGAYGDCRPVTDGSWAVADTAWARAIRETQIIVLPGNEENQHHYAVPLFQNGLVAGVLTIVFQGNPTDCLLGRDEDADSLKLAAEYYLHDYQSGSSRTNRSRAQAAAVPAKLTARQLLILKWISTGKTYASISREMHISESLVKQEAVRLFRYFGVDNRVSVLEKAALDGFLPAPE